MEHTTNRRLRERRESKEKEEDRRTHTHTEETEEECEDRRKQRRERERETTRIHLEERKKEWGTATVGKERVQEEQERRRWREQREKGEEECIAIAEIGGVQIQIVTEPRSVPCAHHARRCTRVHVRVASSVRLCDSVRRSNWQLFGKCKPICDCSGCQGEADSVSRQSLSSFNSWLKTTGQLPRRRVTSPLAETRPEIKPITAQVVPGEVC